MHESLKPKYAYTWLTGSLIFTVNAIFILKLEMLWAFLQTGSGAENATGETNLKVKKLNAENIQGLYKNKDRFKNGIFSITWIPCITLLAMIYNLLTFLSPYEIIHLLPCYSDTYKKMFFSSVYAVFHCIHTYVVFLVFRWYFSFFINFICWRSLLGSKT